MSDIERIKDLEEKVDNMSEVVHELQQELARYKGFVGGILWVCGAMFAALKLAWPALEKLLGKG